MFDLSTMNFTYADGTILSYLEMLDCLQLYVRENHSKTLSGHLGNNTEIIFKYIERYLLNNQINLPNGYSLAEIVKMLSEDMMGRGFMAAYLDEPEKLEEININAFDTAKITLAGGNHFFADRSFLSPEHSIKTFKNLVSKCGGILDESSPAAKVSLADNIRCTVLIPPLVSKKVGSVASIRSVNTQALTAENIEKSQTATPEIIDFLRFCMYHGVSICFGGATGSGKTATLGWLLSDVPNDKRVITIEEGTNDFEFLIKRDKNGCVINDVINLYTKRSANPEQDYNQMTLVSLSMTLDPDIIVVGEIVDLACFTTQEVARTGHTALTTIHSVSAEDTYEKLTTLAMRHPDAHGFSEDYLMRLMIKAFPIIVYLKKNEDDNRRIMEVYEGIGYKNGETIGRPIYNFTVYDNKVIDEKVVKVIGQHEKSNGISEHLQHVLLNNGAKKSDVLMYAQGGNK